MSERYMCSYLCPCFLDDAKEWAQTSEETLNKHKRTAVPGLDNEDTAGNMRLSMTTINGVVTYESFEECLEYV